MQRFATMDAHRTAKLTAFRQTPVVRHSFAIQHFMFDMRRPTRATEPMKQSDFVRTAGKEIVKEFRALTTTAQSNTSSAEQSSRSASAAPPPATITATHEFVPPPTLLQPRITMLPVPPIDPYARYVETAMFQLAEQQSITNWAGTAAQRAQYSDYLSRVQSASTYPTPTMGHVMLHVSITIQNRAYR